MGRMKLREAQRMHQGAVEQALHLCPGRATPQLPLCKWGSWQGECNQFLAQGDVCH